jgi:TonB family protein
MKTIVIIAGIVLLLIMGSVPASFAQANKSKNGVFDKVDEMPVYPGGEEALRKDLVAAVKYPEEAKKSGIQGKVFVSFVVDEAGKVTDVTLAKGVDPSLDKEALRVVKGLKDWTPGKEKGKKVKVAFTLPIQFALDDKKEKK